MFCLGSVSAAENDTIYVNTAGNDTTGNGSAENPYLTIQKGVSSVNENGIIYIANGQYNGANNTNISIAKNMTITGNSPTETIIEGQGLIFLINPNVNVIIQNLTLKNGTAAFGGAICNYGTLRVENCTFVNNSATQAGGAITNWFGTLNVIDCTFLNNTSPEGGSILNLGGNCTVNGSTFINNTATNAFFGGAAIFDLQGNLNITGSNFTNNNATASDGAAVYSSGNLNIYGCTFTGNEGGAVINEYGTLNITTSNFRNNSAIYYGGAVYTYGNCTVSSSNFTNNNAHDGGCIGSFGILTVSDSTFTGNQAEELGGAIYIEGNLTVENCTFILNNGTSGGAICNNGTSTINSSIFNNNTAYAIGNAIGGAIRNLGTLSVADCTFNNNSASGNWNIMGGAIGNYCFINDSSSTSVNCTITNCTFTGNSAQIGGAIENSCSVGNSGSGTANCNITGSTFLNNIADSGGAIYNRCFSWGGFAFANCNVTSCTLIKNAANDNGGAFFNGGNSTNFSSTLNSHFNRIYNNTATQGNALYCNSGSVNAENNWWGSNENPKNINNLINGTINNVDTDPWLIMEFTVNPATISQGQTSNLIASFNRNSDGILVGNSNNHLPDGTPVTFTTNLGNVGSKSVVIGTINGVATAVLRGDEAAGAAFTTATLDGQTLNTTVTITPTASAASSTTRTIGMQETGMPIVALVFAVLMLFSGLITPKR